MTLDTTVPSNPSYLLQYGCQVTVFPADQINRIEVYRAPDNGSGAPNDGAAVQATVLPPSPVGGVTFIDLLPNDNAKRYYKSRHIDAAGTASVFTSYSDGLVPVLITGALAPNPMAAFGAIVDQLPPASLYELRFAGSGSGGGGSWGYPDPDTLDGLQSYIDFPASTNFMRIGQTPKLVEAAATSGGLIKITITAHGYITGDVVTIRGHLGVTAANGTWVITLVDANNFTLNGSTFSGSDTPNTGHCVRLQLVVTAAGVSKFYGGLESTSVIVRDANAKVVMNVSGTNRIFAIPVETSVDSGTAITLDLSTGLTKQVRLTGTATFTLTNPTDGGRYRLWLQQDETGSRPFPTIKNATGDELVMFVNDTAPTLTTTPGQFDLFELEYRVIPTARFSCITLQTNVTPISPKVQAVPKDTANTASAATLAVDMPATTVAGELLLMLVGVNNTSGFGATPTGWTAQTTTLTGTSLSTKIYTKIADGTEGGTQVSVSFSVNGAGTATVYRIARWFGNLSTGLAIANLTHAADVNPNAPSLTPAWGAERNLWLAMWGADGNVTTSAFPASYTSGDTIQNASKPTIASARRFLYAVTEDPGTATISASSGWHAYTVAIRPPA